MADVVEIIVQDGIPGPKGDAGESAYQVAVDNGFEGTESEWLASLQGEPGEQGPKGDPGDPGDLSGYVQKVPEPTAGRFAALTGDGGIEDSGWQSSDFATAAQGSLADTAVQPGDLPAAPTWTTISGKPAFVAEGANAAAARTALGLGTAATTASTAYATAAQGTLANTAVQPAAIANVVRSQQEGSVGTVISNIIAMTQQQYDELVVKNPASYYIITD